MKYLKILFLLAISFSFIPVDVDAQAFRRDGYWLLNNVDMSPQDRDAFLQALHQVDPSAYTITEQGESTSRDYGTLSMEDVIMTELNSGHELEPPLAANWAVEWIITPIFFLKRAITWDAVAPDPGVAAQIDAILSRYEYVEQ